MIRRIAFIHTVAMLVERFRPRHFQELMERLLQEDIGIEKFTSRIVLRQSSGRRTYPLNLIAAQLHHA